MRAIAPRVSTWASAVLLALGSVALAPTTASAAVTSTVTDGVLSVRGDGEADRITVACQAGELKVNELDPGTGPAACSSITAIQVAGGGGDDTIDLSRVAADQLTALVSVMASGGGGNDGITGSPLDDALTGGRGDDRMTPGDGTDALDGGKGTDTISIRAAGDVTLTDDGATHAGGSATLSGFEAAEVRASDPSTPAVLDASGFSYPTSLVGSDGDDTLIGGPADDTLVGGSGNDVLRSGAGDDVLDPGTGESDTVDGGPGADTLQLRGDGRFTITDSSVEGEAGVAADLSRVEGLRVSGGLGDDRIDASGFSGTTLLEGGEGDDVLTGGPGADSIAGGPGNDRLVGGGGGDRLSGDDGNDVLVGGDGDDSIAGGPGNDRLAGGGGDDRLSGDDGKDRLEGGPGDDEMDGGEGKDSCVGGPGENRLLDC